jgi:hypothetical protein
MRGKRFSGGAESPAARAPPHVNDKNAASTSNAASKSPERPARAPVEDGPDEWRD